MLGGFFQSHRDLQQFFLCGLIFRLCKCGVRLFVCCAFGSALYCRLRKCGVRLFVCCTCGGGPVSYTHLFGPDEADNRLGYGYLFWRGQHNSFRADGKYAKFAIVLRDIEAIAVINAHEPRQQLVLDTFWETLYPQLAQ